RHLVRGGVAGLDVEDVALVVSADDDDQVDGVREQVPPAGGPQVRAVAVAGHYRRVARDRRRGDRVVHEQGHPRLALSHPRATTAESEYANRLFPAVKGPPSRKGGGASTTIDMSANTVPALGLPGGPSTKCSDDVAVVVSQTSATSKIHTRCAPLPKT